MKPQIRKIVTNRDLTFIEGGREAPKPLLLVAAAAVVTNPWYGKPFTEDLSPEIRAFAPVLGALLTEQIGAAIGGIDRVEAYGKAAICGTAGEIEHASALIHTLHFGNHYRRAVGARTYLAFTNLRAGAGTAISIPLMDKHDEGRRSHYLTVHFQIPDAPAPDEIVIALGASDGGRPHHRIGDRYKDLEELKSTQG